jgi:hypothetical protein
LPVCALCTLHGQPATPVANPIGLLTSRGDLLAAATHSYGEIDGEAHVLVPVCPEHVVDIYRGRVTAVRMAWRLGPSDGDLATVGHGGREAGSASLA